MRNLVCIETIVKFYMDQIGHCFKLRNFKSTGNEHNIGCMLNNIIIIIKIRITYVNFNFLCTRISHE